MLYQKKRKMCDLCIPYFLGECPVQYRVLYEQHLSSCANCRQELNELDLIWQTLPHDMEEIALPADLKDEVISSILNPPKQSKTSRWIFPKIGVAFMLVPLLIASLILNVIFLMDQKQQHHDIPVQVVSLMPFKADNPEYASSSGMACILQQGDDQQLVLYMYGLPASTGEDMYQVWLLNNEQRVRVGSFQVRDDGFGVITVDMNQVRPFDSIQVTLELDVSGPAARSIQIFKT